MTKDAVDVHQEFSKMVVDNICKNCEFSDRHYDKYLDNKDLYICDIGAEDTIKPYYKTVKGSQKACMFFEVDFNLSFPEYFGTKTEKLKK